ncbi:MAG: hypothetical protein MUQ10_07770 [Anaerolineae bacterium]|nr:hypothetical protein [Anaerolineae bacterium]
MKPEHFLLAFAGLIVVSCSATGPASSPTVETGHSVVSTQVPQVAQRTPDVRPTEPMQPVPTSTRTPVAAADTVTPDLSGNTPSPEPVPDGFSVVDERTIDAYTVRMWRSDDQNASIFENVVTIARGTDVLVRIEFAAEIDELTGTDITGEGHPDVVIRRYSGGAHCCFSTWVYDLGTTLKEVLRSPESNCEGSFTDVDSDGSLEFITCDDSFAYVFCPYAGSPVVPVVLRYAEGSESYVPANIQFADVYDEYIESGEIRAQNALAGEMGEWDGSTKCSVLPVVLGLLYSGQAGQSWGILGATYEDPDIALYWMEVVRIARMSPLFVEGELFVDAEIPSYYMLQLLTSCGTDRGYVGFLTADGLDYCGEGVVYRDIYWLEHELRQIGLVVEQEHLKISPDGCTSDCRLDIVQVEGSRIGSIRLDTSGGFPGAVYRVNGAESNHWVLRGDLVWEEK